MDGQRDSAVYRRNRVEMKAGGALMMAGCQPSATSGHWCPLYSLAHVCPWDGLVDVRAWDGYADVYP